MSQIDSIFVHGLYMEQNSKVAHRSSIWPFAPDNRVAAATHACRCEIATPSLP
jgi:hypothetical protein